MLRRDLESAVDGKQASVAALLIKAHAGEGNRAD